ncbi:AmmeMemoRadiSam system protein B [Ideonella sp. B7]|uniref:AmmeMemoRadiSam system protein B n=1 Tax=Ideonella benzenivorans TaxID=2831643 RepID=UPI001CED638E|nr:AmmeMemoRadiSam system protein B [Ideonella benzenivorans]MCA6215708.1 AmmeMemoRadiSam system protein B [Ideonella benzenivorans]
MPTAAHRPAAVAGRFYPAAPARLRAELQGYLDEVPAPPPASQPPKLLVVPHAGTVYSGPVAAHAYALLRPWHDRIHRVVLLGPTHRVAVHGLAAPTVAAFDTPLGPVPLDRAALDGLADLPQVSFSDRAHAQEHALEVQLPFLQLVLDDFQLVPLAVGDAAPEAVAQVLERLWGDDETLIVISSDLSHYLPYDQARAVDAHTVDRLLHRLPELDPQEACGAMPLNGALLCARRHHLAPRLLDLRNSGDTAGDRSRVVGYAALAFAASAEAAPPDRPTAPLDPDADPLLGRALLARARNAIASVLNLPLRPEPAHPALALPGATFVTLHRGGALRGCIGRLEAGRHSLDEDVRRNARNAAFEDPRFAPLTAEEWPDLQLEVSLLTAPEPLPVRDEADACARLHPGVDGVILNWRGRQATFLPQVWQQLPDPMDFLAALKRKAGLPADFWAEDLTLARYRVCAFEEQPPTDAARDPS